MGLDFSLLCFEPLGRHHDRPAFSCDEPSLTDYLRRQARQDAARDLASCWVLCAPNDPRIIGYYTLTATSVDVSNLPPTLSKRSGRYKVVGAALLGRLAVDSRYAHQGVGTQLLLDSLRRVLRTTQHGIGIKAVVVDALNEGVARFYEKFGFERIETPREDGALEPIRLVIALDTVREIFPDEGGDSDGTPSVVVEDV